MTRTGSTRVLTWTCVALVAVVVAVVGPPTIGQQRSSAAQPAAETSAKPLAEAPAETPVPEEAKPTKKEFRGRLPAYYNRVVDEKQRDKIYGIQREYSPKIDALEAQLAALTAERDEQITAVLTPEQLKTVEQLKAEAKADRDRGKKVKAPSE